MTMEGAVSLSVSVCVCLCGCRFLYVGLFWLSSCSCVCLCVGSCMCVCFDSVRQAVCLCVFLRPFVFIDSVREALCLCVFLRPFVSLCFCLSVSNCFVCEKSAVMWECWVGNNRSHGCGFKNANNWGNTKFFDALPFLKYHGFESSIV